MGFLWEVTEMSWNYIVVMVTQHCEYAKSHWSAHFEMIKFYMGPYFIKNCKWNKIILNVELWVNIISVGNLCNNF
jgi:hypothetical protein